MGENEKMTASRESNSDGIGQGAEGGTRGRRADRGGGHCDDVAVERRAASACWRTAVLMVLKALILVVFALASIKGGLDSGIL